MTVLIVLLVLIVVVLGWAVAIYNRLVRLRNLVKEGWSGIEVQLKRRANASILSWKMASSRPRLP